MTKWTALLCSVCKERYFTIAHALDHMVRTRRYFNIHSANFKSQRVKEMLGEGVFRRPSGFLKYFVLVGIPSLIFFGFLGLFRKGWRRLLGRALDKSRSATDPDVEAGEETGSVDSPSKYFCHSDVSVEPVESEVQKEVAKGSSSTSNEQSLSESAEPSEQDDKQPSSTAVSGSCSVEASGVDGEESDPLSEGPSSKSHVSIQTPSFVKSLNAYDGTRSSFNFSPCSSSMVYTDSTMTYGDSMAMKESNEVMDRDEAGSPVSKSTPESCKKNRIRSQLQLPREVIGRFIGKQGRNIKALMQESGGAYVYLNQKSVPLDAAIVPCTIQGTLKQVNEALAIIERKYPEISIADALVNPDPTPYTQRRVPLFPTPPCSAVLTESVPLDSWECELGQARIPDNSFPATVTFIESITHVWIAPGDVSKDMDELNRNMSYSYCYGNTMKHCPPMPADNQTDMIGRFCAVKVSDIHWLRGRIVKYGEDLLTYEVQLVDYGSYVMVPSSSLNPLRKEYCKLPALAFKVQLAHVQATEENSHDGLSALQQMMENAELEVHVTGKAPISMSLDEKDKDLSGWIKSLSSSSTPVKPASVSSEKVVNGSTEPVGQIVEGAGTPRSQCISETSLLSEQSICNGDSGVLSLSTTKSLECSTPASSRGEPLGLPNSHPNSTGLNTAKERHSTSYETTQNGSPKDETLPNCFEGGESFSIGPLPGPKLNSSGAEASKTPPSGYGSEASGSFLESACSTKEPTGKTVSVNGTKPSLEKSALMLEEVEMSYHALPDLAPYVPVVEIYTQLGAQKPTFVNRELVELGHAVWIEEKSMS